MNPNQAFKDREFTGQGLAKATKQQIEAIEFGIQSKGFSYGVLLIMVLDLKFSESVRIEDLSFLQAAKLIIYIQSH